MNIKYLAMCICGALASLACCRAYTDLSVPDFEKMLLDDSSVQLVDVRTPEEYAQGHIRGAINIDWYADGFIDEAKAVLSPAQPVLVYCRSGKRSASAATLLAKNSFRVYNLSGGFLAWAEAGKASSVYELERFLTPAGEPLSITLIKHASLELRYKGLSIQVDPVSGYGTPTDYGEEFGKADVVLVTHEHPDHFDKTAIADLKADETILVTNVRCTQMLGWGKAVSNGETLSLPADITLEAVPAYNTTEGRLQFHPRGRDNGYILTLGGLRVYIAGDTEVIPEMSDFKDIDIAFLPVNQPYTMTVDQCVEAAKIISPKVLIPYHFSKTDVSSLPGRLPQTRVLLRNMQ